MYGIFCYMWVILWVNVGNLWDPESLKWVDPHPLFMANIITVLLPPGPFRRHSLLLVSPSLWAPVMASVFSNLFSWGVQWVCPKGSCCFQKLEIVIVVFNIIPTQAIMKMIAWVTWNMIPSKQTFRLFESKRTNAWKHQVSKSHWEY